MGITVDFAQGKVPEDAAGWARAFRRAPVTPSAGSVTPTELAPETTDLIDSTAGTAATAAIADHVAESDPHLQYTMQSDVDAAAGAAQSGAIAASAASLAAHVAAADPHPGYTTAAELSAAITAHEGASDPHPVYLTQTEGDARYLQLTLTLTNAADDTAAAAAGVAVGRLYRNGSVVMIRVT